MVADQHRLADLVALPDPASRVGEHHDLAPGRHRGAHAVHHGRRVVSLVQVDPAEEHQSADRPGPDRPDDGGVAAHRRRREAAEVGERYLRVGDAERVGGRRPAGAEHHGDVVPGLAGQFRQPGGTGLRRLVRIGGRRHALTYGFPSAAGGRTRPTSPATAMIVATYGAISRMNEETGTRRTDSSVCSW